MTYIPGSCSHFGNSYFGGPLYNTNRVAASTAAGYIFTEVRRWQRYGTGSFVCYFSTGRSER